MTSPAGWTARDTREVPDRRTAGMVIVVVSLMATVWPGAPQWLVLTGFSAAAALGLPLLLARSARLAARVLPVVVVALAVLAGLAAWGRATSNLVERDRAHDGGVIVTREAAAALSRGENPYTADYGPVLPESWRQVQGSDGSLVENPVRHHFPYLPAAALVHVPFVMAADAVDWQWDPRVAGWVALTVAMVAVARLDAPAWARVGGVAGVGSALAIIYLSWGTNDPFAAALAVLALVLAERRPAWAGVVLAVAVSAKVLLALILVPLTVVVVHRGGWSAVRRWWTFPVAMGVSVLPALIAAPSAFLDDTVWFNLGRTEPKMPTSGIGVPAWAPGLPGGALAVLTVVGVALAVGLPVMAARRRPSVWTAGAASGLGLLGLLVPARTFQVNYLVLVAALIPLCWLASSVNQPAEVGGPEPPAAPG